MMEWLLHGNDEYDDGNISFITYINLCSRFMIANMLLKSKKKKYFITFC